MSELQLPWQGLQIVDLPFINFFCWLAAWGWPYIGSPWQLNHFVVKTLIPAAAFAAIFATLFLLSLHAHIKVQDSDIVQSSIFPLPHQLAWESCWLGRWWSAYLPSWCLNVDLKTKQKRPFYPVLSSKKNRYGPFCLALQDKR